MSEGLGEEVHAHMRRILKFAKGLGGDEEDVASALLWASVQWAATHGCPPDIVASALSNAAFKVNSVMGGEESIQ